MPDVHAADRTRLRELLSTRLSLAELKSLAFDLEIDHEALPYANKPELVLELLRRMEQLDRPLSEIEAWLRRNRPDTAVDLPAAPPASEPASAVFDQRGQRVGTQINIAGNVIHIEGDGNVIGDGSSSRVVKGAGAPQDPPASPNLDTAGLRRALGRYDDVELDALCLDHFPKVFDAFSRGMRHDEKLNLLLDACRRHPEVATRLAGLLNKEDR